MPLTNDEGEWPLLVDESRSMLDASVLIYGISQLRQLARKGKLSGHDVKERILDLPITIKDCIDVAMSNRKVLEDHVGEVKAELYGNGLLDVWGNLHRAAAENQDGMSIIHASIVVFDDEHSNSECVYAIGVNRLQKIIALAFRGSVTVTDFRVDLDGHMFQLKNPMPGADSDETLGIHHGFYEYLFGTTLLKKRGGGQETKFESIMNHLLSLFEQYPDFRLYITGHSLGGALATLSTVEVAASSSNHSIPMPVTCISFASPKVGDIDFWRCFEKMEDDGMIRSVRFVNHLDIIPTMPDRNNCSCIRNMTCRKPPVYRHVGLRIKLYPGGKYEVTYERAHVETTWEKLKEFRWSLGYQVGIFMMTPSLYRHKDDFIQNHSCDGYFKKFNSFAQGDGKGLFLNDLYKSKLEHNVGFW